MSDEVDSRGRYTPSHDKKQADMQRVALVERWYSKSDVACKAQLTLLAGNESEPRDFLERQKPAEDHVPGDVPSNADTHIRCD